MADISAPRSWPPMAMLVIIALLTQLNHVMADLPRTTTRTVAENRPDDADSKRALVDPESEKVVMELVQAHLPELTNVLKQLRSVQPQQYQVAIKDLSRAARKLELAKKRDPRLFDIEVELLQAEHQASLLMAKLKVRDSQSDRQKLRQAAERLQQAQIIRAQYDVDVFRQRVIRAEQQWEIAKQRLESRQQDQETQLEKSFLSMLRKAGRDVQRTDSDAGRTPKRSPPSQRPASQHLDADTQVSE